jgi:hypothetical protein
MLRCDACICAERTVEAIFVIQFVVVLVQPALARG